ncbi:hypothetical protein LHYA1_G008982 [Lachnellula hyalina]|uniref:NAD(P)-binding protein n=1 Tax=Lachnellula hyalina TaxID=1316788 RepID=A0A8H8QTI8_9HELO|nr:uncharacterized protein LHYA1_G008982 [Lachnellula hyalina]TVY22383.1 hypothetical protein LHYA1_G008982 [Lachnellula hyalina]
MNPRTLLILGSGPRIGSAISEKFAADGYNIALVSRNGSNSINDKGYLSLKADFADNDPSVLASVFEKVVSEFNAPPSVVVYNAGSITPPSDPDSALSIPSTRVTNDLNVNVITPFIAAQHAIKHWASLPTDLDLPKLFIYTGNICNVAILPTPLLLNGGMGKAASAYWIGVADGSYAAKGYRQVLILLLVLIYTSIDSAYAYDMYLKSKTFPRRRERAGWLTDFPSFLYADQRLADGKLAGQAVDGPAHADFYMRLAASGAEGVPWHATFVKDKGYIEF